MKTEGTFEGMTERMNDGTNEVTKGFKGFQNTCFRTQYWGSGPEVFDYPKHHG